MERGVINHYLEDLSIGLQISRAGYTSTQGHGDLGKAEQRTPKIAQDRRCLAWRSISASGSTVSDHSCGRKESDMLKIRLQPSDDVRTIAAERPRDTY
jgi:hypothetical protein